MSTSASESLTTTAADLAQLFGAHDPSMGVFPTDALVGRMLDFGEGISDLVFSPGRPPQVEQHGQLTPVPMSGLVPLTTDHTARIARHLVTGHHQAVCALRDQGACDLSYALGSRARFRVNVFRQRGSFAIVMRVIATKVPTLQELGLPRSLAEIAALKSGIVLVTGPTGSGKSSTLAAMIDLINETRAEHIITIEDPVEFLHEHKKGTVHQRELHSDTPTFGLALRAALRQAPKVILVGEMRDRDTMEIALTAAETGHLVFSTLHTIDASRTVDRIIGAFDVGDQEAIRIRLAATFRAFISQRLVPRKSGGRIAVLEILRSTLRTRDYIEKGDTQGRSLLDAMHDGSMDGMQTFDGEIERLVRGGVISGSVGLLYATNPANLRVIMADVALDDAPPPVDDTVEGLEHGLISQ